MVSNPYTIIQSFFPLCCTGCCQFDICHHETLFHYIYWQKNIFKYLLIIYSPLRHSVCIGFCQTMTYPYSSYLSQKVQEHALYRYMQPCAISFTLRVSSGPEHQLTAGMETQIDIYKQKTQSEIAGKGIPRKNICQEVFPSPWQYIVYIQ